MRVYQLKYYEVMLSDGQPSAAAALQQYELLCSRLLTVEALATNRCLELARVHKGSITQHTDRIRQYLNNRQYRPFHFLLAKN
ncbi:MAG: hypothetical protein P0Y53_08625 [Candidatus Pseudobacter hemicellulosilyticus]|uniref:Uncharacterized protein n=1 Tax=Candidatus Pseudobacter hemicellulosilyticus TaxID=3121375 RepID=A0AAJ6BHB3_9BACT|nr:MAG: hypothetical protein P0Y53_08625 [Pseudobacter sp.]